jgi:cell division protease FtsH
LWLPWCSFAGTAWAGKVSGNYEVILPADLHGLDGDTGSVARPVRFADVAGCDEAKLELTEVVEFLKFPDRFRALGASIPRGLLLYGPPGTGKTMLARAAATEAGVAFVSMSGSGFVEMYVGVGAKRVRNLFAVARKFGKAIIFVDEIDALAKTRGGNNANDEREQALNQLLAEMDGFSSSDSIVVIAATNRMDTLDHAVLRPGRFTRKVNVPLPDIDGRRAILGIHAVGKPLDEAVDMEAIARRTAGMSGAQLADLLNESAIYAARRTHEKITPVDVHDGWLKSILGTSRKRSMDERERSIIAAHEAGTPSAAGSSEIAGGSRRSASSPTATLWGSPSRRRKTTICRPSRTCAQGWSRSWAVVRPKPSSSKT